MYTAFDDIVSHIIARLNVCKICMWMCISVHVDMFYVRMHLCVCHICACVCAGRPWVPFGVSSGPQGHWAHPPDGGCVLSVPSGHSALLPAPAHKILQEVSQADIRADLQTLFLCVKHWSVALMCVFVWWAAVELRAGGRRSPPTSPSKWLRRAQSKTAWSSTSTYVTNSQSQSLYTQCSQSTHTHTHTNSLSHTHTHKLVCHMCLCPQESEVEYRCERCGGQVSSLRCSFYTLPQ